jgi:hypothetical protein
MRFRVYCECGGHIVVSEAAAGAKLPCACGRTVSVPSLHELRVEAGLPPYNVSPELVIEAMLLSGEMPFDNRCV